MLRNQQLAHALALFRHGNFHRAAASQSISQPAFSRSIRSLERELGVTLFDRHTGGITPTLYGEALLRRAETIITEAGELEREIRLLQELEIGEFAVAMAPYPAELSGGRAAGELISRHSGLHCRITLSDWRKVAGQVLDRSVDLGFAETSVAETDERLQTDVVGRHDLVFYCRKGHPLSGRSSVSKSDLDAYPVVAVRLPARMASVFPGRAEFDEDTGHLIPAIEIEDLTTARAIVGHSNAFSAATPLQVESSLHTGEFAVLPFRASWMKLNYGFISRRDRMLSPAAEVFMERVRHIEKDLVSRNRELMERVFSAK